MTGLSSDKRTLPSRSLRGPEKVAALLLAMGKPSAGKLLKHFNDEEIRMIAQSAAGLGMIPRWMLDSIVEEFEDRVQSGSDLEGTLGEAEQLLAGVLPADKLLEIMAHVRGQSHQSVWPRLSSSSEAAIAQYLSKEHPQVAAFVLSKASPACAAAVIGLMTADLRDEVMRRMVSTTRVADQTLQIIETTLNDDLLVAAKRNSGPDIHARMADIINKMDREQMDAVLHSLFQHRPKEAKIVKGLLFTFDDISKLTDASRIKLFDQLSPDQIILSLKGATLQLRELILASVPSRARRMIESELQSGGPAVHKDVAKARRTIADLALDMLDQGVIELETTEDAAG